MVPLCSKKLFVLCICIVSASLSAEEGKKKLDRELSVTEQIAYSTVRISCKGPSIKGESVGTGFILNLSENKGTSAPVIVTNKHVVRGATEGSFRFVSKDATNKPNPNNHVSLQITNFQKVLILHPDKDVDLCCIMFGALLKELPPNKNVFYRSIPLSFIPDSEKLSTLGAVENILMVGYPMGIWDERNNLPIFRSGITATHPNIDYQGKSVFLIDTACTYGSSGSPVFLYDEGSYTDAFGKTNLGGSRCYLLGIVHKAIFQTVDGKISVIDIPTQLTPIAKTQVPMNLGIVIKADKLRDFAKIYNEGLKHGGSLTPIPKTKTPENPSKQ